MYTKKIQGKRVYLSPLNMENLNTYHKWANNPEIACHTNFYHENTSFHTIKESFEKWMLEPYFEIRIEANNALIGYCGLVRCKEISRSAELTIVIGEADYLNNGYGTDALKTLCLYAFDYLNYHSLSLKSTTSNLRAHKVYNKIGFKKVGILREGYYFNGKYENFVIMDLLRKDLKEK